MKLKLDPVKKAGTLTADGSLTVQRMGEMKTALIRALDEVDTVELHFDEVTEVDLSCLQLLCSAHRTSAKKNKRVILARDCADSFQKALKDSGYTRREGCRSTADGRHCLWLTGKGLRDENHSDS
jgi:ABC-type transporter Mla MlaB component